MNDQLIGQQPVDLIVQRPVAQLDRTQSHDKINRKES